MKFKNGDRVIYKSDKDTKVPQRVPSIRRFRIIGYSRLIAESRYYYCVSNINEEVGEIFLEKYLELDKEWYRKQKIKSLLE